MLQSVTGTIDLEQVYSRNVNTVWHVCLAYMKNIQDAEDALQETFLRLIKSGKKFEDENNEKAWLIVTAGNVCKDLLKHWWRKREQIEDHENSLVFPEYEIDTTLLAVMELPDKYKLAVYLYYYMDYNSREIASILHRPESTIRSQLGEAKRQLRDILKEE